MNEDEAMRELRLYLHNSGISRKFDQQTRIIDKLVKKFSGNGNFEPFEYLIKLGIEPDYFDHIMVIVKAKGKV